MSDLFVGEDFRLVTHCYKELTRFLGKLAKKYKKDLILSGYTALLELKKTNPGKDFEDVEMYRVVNRAINREYRIKKEEHYFISTSKSFVDYDENSASFESELIDESTYFDKYDLEFLSSCVNSILDEYGEKQRLILNFYFFECNNRVTTCRKFGISNHMLRELVRGYRDKLSDELILCGYDEVKAYIKEQDEFVLDQGHKNAYERFKAKKQGVILYNVNDYLIYKLMRDSDKICEYADFLQCTENDLRTILTHGKSAGKLHLYQIQALRKTYFPAYTLQELVAI